MKTKRLKGKRTGAKPACLERLVSRLCKHEERNGDLAAYWRTSRDGFCMGCNEQWARILTINSRGWQTRLCEKCLAQVIADALRD